MKQKILLKDCEGRDITHLRISITSHCNLQCAYCHKEGEEGLDRMQQMPLPMIQNILSSFSLIGVKHLKITGGEPLLREDLCDIIAHAKSAGIEDISLTTNGILLAQKARKLREAGLSRLNVGCDSLSSNISAKNRDAILPGIIEAQHAGFKNLKVNMVVLRNVNDSEIDKMIQFARDYRVILQLIELIPTDDEFYSKHYFSLAPIEKQVASIAKSCRTRELQGRRQYDLDSTTVEFVRPFHEKFCHNCTKIRVTSSGFIKPCLMRNDNLVRFNGLSSVLEAISHRRIYCDRDDRYIGKRSYSTNCTSIR